MPLILPANTLVSTVTYDVANSCRFNDDDSSKLSKTMVAGDEDKWTMSMWVKRGNISQTDPTSRCLFFAGSDNGVFFKSDDTLNFYHYTDSYVGQLITTRKFRDVGAWYHFVFVWDSGNATAGNRMRIYVNGVEETVFGTDTQPAQDANSGFNIADDTFYIGINDGDTPYLDAYVAEVVFLDGTAATPTSFGEFNSDSPTIWQPIDVSGLTFGNNGFYLDFEDSSNLGNDANGGTDFTEVNLAAADQATDTPTNNFCTMNPLANYINGSTFTDGNNTMTTANNTRSYNIATMGLTSGKWYFETYMNELVSGPGQNTLIGIADAETTNLGNQLGILASQYAYYATTGGSYNSNTDTGYGDTYTTGNYIGTYIDLDNNKIYWAKDGVIQNSGTGVTITAASGTPGGAYLPALGFWSNIPIYKYNLNFGGCPSFAISSGNADANGYGNFEYDPSDGGGSSFDSAAKDFLAICTKNLGSDGG